MTASPPHPDSPGSSRMRVLGIQRAQWRDLWAGTVAVSPLMPGAVVFGLAFGALIQVVGLPWWMAPYASSTVTAGASQIAIVEALRQNAPMAIAVITALVINARLALYSAAMAPIFAAFPRRWRFALAYLMTDQSAAVTSMEVDKWPDPVRRRWFVLGVSGPFVGIWILGTTAGVILGPVIPESWQIGFIVPLMFIAVLVPGLRTWPGVAAAGISIATVLLLKDLPYGLNVLTGALLGIALGSFVPDRSHPVDEEAVPPGAAPEAHDP
ncbi:AzlC family ABC transporter permease [uncultured Demequina sp.]|uniref:AzlC family ABC transporter permease n=1 Tax=uncultured Demequina sp. TaxID=693499 RepID=UPI0025DB7730|nr:AzlC family ABC transporter permease [uncultured Demequina sp.]